MTFPLPLSSVEALGLDPKPLARLRELITAHIAEGRYPAAQIAVARHGKLGLVWTLGDARLDPQRVPARDETLWLLCSNTKVITACAVWIPVERGALAFTDRVADHVPGFEANGKGDISIIQLLSHQGGFPNADSKLFDADVPYAEVVAHIAASPARWEPGTDAAYHPSSGWKVLGAVVERVDGRPVDRYVREEVFLPYQYFLWLGRTRR